MEHTKRHHGTVTEPVPPVCQDVHHHVNGDGVLSEKGAACDVLCMASETALAHNRQHVVHDAVNHLQKHPEARAGPGAKPHVT